VFSAAGNEKFRLKKTSGGSERRIPIL